MNTLATIAPETLMEEQTETNESQKQVSRNTFICIVDSIVLKSKKRESSCLKKACKLTGMVLDLKDPDLKRARHAIFAYESDSSSSCEK